MATSRRDSFTIQVLQLTDALIVWAAFLVGGILRNTFLSVEDTEAVTSMNWVLYIAVPFTPLALEHFGFYEHLRHKTTGAAVWQIIRALLVIVLFIGVFAVFARAPAARRLSLGIGLILVFVFLAIRDRLTRCLLKRRLKNENTRERVIIAGSTGAMEELIADLDPEITSGWQIVDQFDLGERGIDEFFNILKQKSVARVIFSARNTKFEIVAQAVEACELQGVEAWISASFIRTQIARPVFDVIGSKPMLVLRSTPELSWQLLCKEVMDRVGAALLITVTSPLWLIAAVGIAIKSPGAPVFFSQMRAGRYGQPFRMWKFRTMVANADKMLDEIKAQHGNQMEGPVFKLDNDPRIFPFGALLRKLSIDELPQLLNVLMGDMSLVGPRPLPVYEVEAFCEISHRRRLSVKPGITCEWQVSGRNKITSFDDWIAMDLRYIDNWSLWLDCQILLRTVPAVLFGKGAK